LRGWALSTAMWDNGQPFRTSDITRQGYVFAGLYRDSAFTQRVELDERISEPTTLHVRWEPYNPSRSWWDRHHTVVVVSALILVFVLTAAVITFVLATKKD